ncbi:methionyl-tRNA formyltransferase [Flavobacterium sp. NST-5]|uniref:Methionyl-tRNA formyltransferase n=1 Tax=Flavobacterium ichthyis TaxID=2698827 RepID=A0ABW9Z6J7_9FLAO|nr:methionyl-tRNA formyltransferase [Flavobacterium ichthyis]NBL64465.1 methionyl-tRNA formyltransferase [Flavobacterium ichthyis]
MEKLKIVFMGTPDFAVGILDAIIQKKYDVVGVITAADKPAGRGQKIKYSAVKEYALQNNLKLLQPTNLKDENFLKELKALDATLQVVVAFRMLPEVVWKMPSLGTFNLHASLLPNYRGAAPINWAIINGEKNTGVTTFFIDDKIDTGAMILSKKIEITDDENAGVLHDKLMNLGKNAVIETLELIKNNNVNTEIQQETQGLKTAYKLNKDNCKIDFSQSGKAIYNLIRGLSPYPGAWCFFEDSGNQWSVKIFEAKFEKETHSVSVGKIITDKKNLKIAVTDGWIVILQLQFPGKKNLKVHEFLNGISFSENAKAF